MSLFDASLSQATNNDGNPVAGAKWWFYLTGTSTPATVYSNATLATSLGTTVTADSAGWFVPIYYDDNVLCRAVLKTPAGATIGGHDIDPINGTIGAASISFLQAGTGAVARTVLAKAREPVTAQDFGATGNGTTDDRAAIQLAADYAAAGKFSLATNGTYKLAYMPTSTHNYAIGPQPNVVLPMNITEFDGGGATLNMYQGGRGFAYWPVFYPETEETATITANVAAGAFTITVNSTTGFAAGDGVIVRAGEFPYDTAEPLIWYFATLVEVVSSTVLKLDTPMLEAFTLASVTGANKTVTKLKPGALKTLYLHDYRLTATSAAQAESGHYIFYRRGVKIERVTGKYMGSGLFVGQYLENCTFSQCGQENVNVSQASYGAAFSFAESRGISVNDCWARGMKTGVKAEASGEIAVNNFLFENTYPGDGVTTPADNTVVVFNIAGRSKLWFNGVTITGLGGFNLSNTSNGQAGYEGTVGGRNLTIRTSAEPYSLGAITQISGKLDLNVAGVRGVYNLDLPKRWRRRVRLKDNMAAVPIYGPMGMVIAARVYTSSGLTIGAGNNLTDFYFGKTTANGSNLAQVASAVFGKPVAGSWTEIPVYAGTVAGAPWTYRNENHKMIISTAAGAGLDHKDEFLFIEVDYVTEESLKNYAYPESLARIDDGYDFYEAYFPAVNLANIAAAGTLVQTFTIADITANDTYIGFGIVGGYGGLVIQKAEPKAGTLDMTFYNPTAGAIDLAARDMRIVWAKAQIGV